MDLDTRSAQEEGRPREVELKLELEPGGDRLLVQHPLLSERLGEERQSVSTYFDTESDELRRAGLSLRVRQSGADYVQTVKASSRGSAGLFDRWEWEEPIPGPDPEVDRIPSLSAQLGKSLLRRPLRPVFATHVGRRSCVIETGEGQVEVVVDRGEVVAGDERQTLLELELELVDGSPKALFDLARMFHAYVPLRIGVLTKSERGRRLASGRTQRASKAEPVRLSPDMTAVEAFRTIAFACIRHFRANESLVANSRDADALHQSRVALRRLRSALSLFRPALAEDRRRSFQDALRSLAAALGEARNLDVLLDRRGALLTARSRDALAAQRARAYDDAIGALRSPSTQRTMIDLAEWIALGTLEDSTRPASARLVGPFSADVLDRYWKKVKWRGRKLLSIDDEARHELRIAGKKLRYAGEFFASLHADRPARDLFLAEMEKLQERLGDLNDLATEQALREELARQGVDLPPLRRKGDDEVFRSKRLAAAERAFRQLDEIGPYWRRS